MRMLATAVLALFAAGIGTSARADDLEDCKSGEPERVIPGCTRLIEAGTLSPHYQAHAYNSRGAANRKIGKLNRAIADFDMAIEINPEHYQAYSNRGLVYNFLRQFDRAIADASRAIELNPEAWYAYANRAIAYRAKKRYDDAIRDYTTALRFQPNRAAVYSNRAYSHMLGGNPEAAFADLERALALGPEDPHVHHTLGESYFQIGESDKAVEAWRTACRVANREVVDNWQRGLAALGYYTGEIDGRCDERVIEAFGRCARDKCLILG